MVTNPPKRGSSPTLWLVSVALLLLFLAAGLLADREADPPLGALDFEGQLLLGARARVPGERIPLGEWDPALLSPVHTQLTAVAFRLFGVSIGTARLVTGLASLAVALLFFSLLRRSFGLPAATLSVLFLMVSPVYLAVGRTAVGAMISLLLMLATVRLWIAGARHAGASLVAGAVLVLAGLIENGPSSLFFLIAGLLMAVTLRLHAWKMTWRLQTRRRLQWLTAGALLAAAAYLTLVLANWQEVGRTWAHVFHVSFRMLVANVLYSPVHILVFLRQLPVTTLAAVGYFLFFAKGAVRPVVRHRRLDEVRLWLLCWLLAGVPYFVLRGVPRIHELVLLLPPLCALGGEGIVHLFRLRRFERPRLDVMIVMLLIAGCSWFVSASAVVLLLRRAELSGYWARHEVRAGLGLVVLGWAALTVGLGWLYLRWKRFTLALRPVPVTVLALALAAGIFGHGIYETGRWWTRRGYEAREASRLVEGLGPDALVVGSWAPLLTLGTPVRSAIIWPALNAGGQPWQHEVTHLLLQEGREMDPGLPPLRLFLPEGGGAGVAETAHHAVIRGRRLVLLEVTRAR